MGRQFVLWISLSDAGARKTPLDKPLWLSATGLIPDAEGAPRLPRGVLLLPAKVGKRAAVAAIVPEALDQATSANRKPLPPGLHQLGHGDNCSGAR